jgi:hypothetical protein
LWFRGCTRSEVRRKTDRDDAGRRGTSGPGLAPGSWPEKSLPLSVRISRLPIARLLFDLSGGQRSQVFEGRARNPLSLRHDFELPRVGPFPVARPGPLVPLRPRAVALRQSRMRRAYFPLFVYTRAHEKQEANVREAREVLRRTSDCRDDRDEGTRQNGTRRDERSRRSGTSCPGLATGSGLPRAAGNRAVGREDFERDLRRPAVGSSVLRSIEVVRWGVSTSERTEATISRASSLERGLDGSSRFGFPLASRQSPVRRTHGTRYVSVTVASPKQTAIVAIAKVWNEKNVRIDTTSSTPVPRAYARATPRRRSASS